MTDLLQMLHPYRFVGVVALLGLAAALATEKGRLPLALRGLMKTLGRDAGRVPAEPRPRAGVSAGRRLLAFALVLAAFLLAMI